MSNAFPCAVEDIESYPYETLNEPTELFSDPPPPRSKLRRLITVTLGAGVCALAGGGSVALAGLDLATPNSFSSWLKRPGIYPRSLSHFT